MNLIESGTFEDPGTNSVVNDEIAALKIDQHINDHLKDKRDLKKKKKTKMRKLIMTMEMMSENDAK